MKSTFDSIWIAAGEDHAVGTDAADRFVISIAPHLAEVITIDDFTLGTDVLRFAGQHRHEASTPVIEVGWVVGGDDGVRNDLHLVVGRLTLILTDLADQIAVDPVYRLNEGFETGIGGWVDAGQDWYGTATQVASGSDGIVSASGDFHLVLEGDDISAPYTELIGQGAIGFEPFTASIEIYLDPSADGAGWADGEGFDYAVAATSTGATAALNFYFNVAQDASTGAMILAAGTVQNPDFVPRDDLETVAGAVEIDADGWYRFEHRFHADDSGNLAVDMTVLDAADEIVFETTLTTTEPVALVSGNPRYAYFELIGVAGGIAVDDLTVAYAGDQVPPLPELANLFCA